MFRPLLIAALLGVLSFPAKADGFQPGMKVPVHAVCKTMEAASSIAEGDAQSEAEAEIRFQYFVGTGECVMLPRPILGLVVAVVLEYNDYDGQAVQVLQMVPAANPNLQDGYMLILKNLAEQVKKETGI